MKDDKYTACAYGGVFLVNLITIIFIILKICKIINWSWFWVFSPIWIIYLVTTISMLIYFYFNK